MPLAAGWWTGADLWAPETVDVSTRGPPRSSHSLVCLIHHLQVGAVRLLNYYHRLTQHKYFNVKSFSPSLKC